LPVKQPGQPDSHPGTMLPPQAAPPVKVALPQAGVQPAGTHGGGAGGAALEVPLLVADLLIQPGLDAVTVTVAEVL